MGEIDNYLSLSFCRSYYYPGEFQLVTNRKVRNTEQLEINNLIMLGADTGKVGVIRHKEIKADERGEEMLTIKGYALGIILRQRITIPPVGQAYDIQEADAETVMKHYVQRNCLDIPDGILIGDAVFSFPITTMPGSLGVFHQLQNAFIIHKVMGRGLPIPTVEIFIVGLCISSCP
jgi:hypothetical protein